MESWNFFPINQFMFLAFRVNCAFLALIWALQVSFWSRWRPRYLTSGALFMFTGGHVLRLVVNVIWVDFSLFTLIFNCFSQSCSRLRWFWRFSDALLGSTSDERMAVSSAKVAIVVLLVCGMSAVNIRYRKGPSTLPCGTPALMGL